MAINDDHAALTVAPAGWFRFMFEDDRWEWSAELERLYGYLPGEAVPTTELVVSHDNSDDGGGLPQLLQTAASSVDHFSAPHRIIDARGRIRDMIITADSVVDDDGAIVGVSGFFVDISPPDDRAVQLKVTDAVAEFTAHRAGIEQAKGMLMLVYGLTAEAAFDLLKWRSQQTNTKLRALAEQIMADFQNLNSRHKASATGDFDSLLATAHLRAAKRDQRAGRAESA